MTDTDTVEVVTGSPRVRVDDKPISTDSMVTVRLSEVNQASDLASDQDPLTGSEQEHEEGQEQEQRLVPDAEPEQNTTTSSRPSSSVSHNSIAASSTSNTESVRPTSVDWEGLERTEEQEPKDEGTDESTSLLLARLDQENAALAANPRAGSSTVPTPRMPTRPPSIQHLKKLVDAPQRQSLRYSQLPAPPMTELEFWAALVSDYVQTAQRLPTLTANKIRGGVPPPLREWVWPSVAGANDPLLLDEFKRLSGESSPYEGLIGKDVGRSFPNIDMFRDPDGDGQRMLGNVLKCFSLYDEKIGYCQGLGFVVGPLLMHMTDAQAFCVLVRLMEHYDLRSCYLPDLSGLHLRIYQYQQLLSEHLPDLAAHLEQLKVEPLYVSQWFLSFFAVTCPLPMLLRIYDVILSEGATETLMRVALSLMGRNTKKILACNEFEDVMHLLLSRSLWDTYHQQADDLVADFASLTSLVSKSTLQSLEESYKTSQTAKTMSLRDTASQFLGRFWGGSAHGSSKSTNNLSLALPSRPTSTMKRSLSKQSLASTLNSAYSSVSDASTLATDVTTPSRKSDPTTSDSASQLERVTSAHPDRDLHSQIEDLLTALSDMHRQHGDLVKELQKEREEREEDKTLATRLLTQLRSQAASVKELLGEDADSTDDEVVDLINTAESRFSMEASRRISILQSKHQLRDSVDEWKGRHETEVLRCKELTERLDTQEKEHAQVKDQLREARARVQEGHRDRQRLEKTIMELRSGKTSTPNTPTDPSFDSTRNVRASICATPTGLREFKLGRSSNEALNQSQQQPPAQPSTFSKRTSSLAAKAIFTSTEIQAPAPDEALLLELVNAKTAEAVARQELEEVKAKLDSLRKMLNVSGSAGNTHPPLTRTNTNASDTSTGSTPGHVSTPSLTFPRTPLGESPNKASPVSMAGSVGTMAGNVAGAAGSFFAGWGKRSVSNIG